MTLVCQLRLDIVRVSEGFTSTQHYTDNPNQAYTVLNKYDLAC